MSHNEYTVFTPEKHGDGQRALRNALGRFATGVTVITAVGADGGKVAITANSFASVSLDPPLVLWSIDNTSPSMDAFQHDMPFNIHILGAKQSGLAQHCAQASQNKFAAIPHDHEMGKAPYIHHVDTAFYCRVHTLYPAGDHTIIIGAVDEVRTVKNPSGDSLIFVGGRFTTPESNR